MGTLLVAREVVLSVESVYGASEFRKTLGKAGEDSRAVRGEERN